MFDEWKSGHFPSFKWQYQTLDGLTFFGELDKAEGWNSRPDYPIRYFLWKTNREAWSDLHYWSFTEEVIRACIEALQGELETLNIEIAEAKSQERANIDDPDGIDESLELFDRTLIETRTQELDSDEILLEVMDDEWIEALREGLHKSPAPCLAAM